MTRNEKRIRELAVISAYSIGDVSKGVNYVMQLYERNKERKLYRFRPPRLYEITALKDDKIYLCRPTFMRIKEIVKYYMIGIIY